MSFTTIRPSSIEGIKRLAKVISKRDDIRHSEALDQASQVSGFANYQHARRSIGDRAAEGEADQTFVYVSCHWRDAKTHVSGQETIRVSLSKSLDELIKPIQYRYARNLGRYRRVASDHVVDEFRPDGASGALARVCAAARTLQFMDITGLRPSKALVAPRGGYRNRLPGNDHGSSWYDPIAKQHVAADEPYLGRALSMAGERQAWAHENNWSLVKPKWKGMYLPEGGCELFLMADNTSGYSLDPIVAALSKAPAPAEPEYCDRVAVEATGFFLSPGEKRDAAQKAAKPATRKVTGVSRGPTNSIEFQLLLGGRRRRPKAIMPVEDHAQVGRLLKEALAAIGRRAVAYKRVNAVRSELDDWVQCEHDRKAMSDEVFFGLYYRDLGGPGHRTVADESGGQESLRQAKAILASRYPDCAPLRALFKKIDFAIAALKPKAQ
ncbi:DUF5623 domain-containing protein [Aminobacter ciceronei]|uniref:DUF5623 domain-containing protein n=1 Tax=Aminobacter ciceronei TaxID=150723 RepID=A0ABR6C679_9HYPH|nr:DUF5623 domain-containing protein [Aminobacter ciceronei]MBA8906463.1 hypothetical protein [Aminobacter ciceronei]MBA9020411.1 hypothetical protein [Aminobacter ciceronei]